MGSQRRVSGYHSGHQRNSITLVTIRGRFIGFRNCQRARDKTGQLPEARTGRCNCPRLRRRGCVIGMVRFRGQFGGEPGSERAMARYSLATLDSKALALRLDAPIAPYLADLQQEQITNDQ